MGSEPELAPPERPEDRQGLLLRVSPRAREIVAQQRQAAHARRRVEERLAAVESSLSALTAELGDISGRLSDVEPLVRSLDDELTRTRALSDQALETASQSQARLDDTEADVLDLARFGKAVSPSMGWAGAAGAYDELRYLLHDLRRRVRTLEGERAPVSTLTGEGGAHLGGRAATAAAAGRFDYVSFQRRFRGSVADVTEVVVERYAEELSRMGPVVDIGCGRGELLGALHRRGVPVVGVEPDAALAAEARDQGVEVAETTASAYLSNQPPGSLGAIVTLHVVEHLEIDDLVELLELSAKALRPGGLFVAETPNPMTFLTMHESYILDPSHIQPIHPALLTFLLEQAGFTQPEVRYHAPASTLWLEHVHSDIDPGLAQGVNAVIDRLNHQIYGPQDYAVWAHTPSSLPG